LDFFVFFSVVFAGFGTIWGLSGARNIRVFGAYAAARRHILAGCGAVSMGNFGVLRAAGVGENA
jgi:hypothetical protein